MFLCVALQVALQATRWRTVIGLGGTVGWGRAAHIFVSAQVANLVVPARGGDALKVLAVRRELGVAGAAGLLLVDKLVDPVALALVLAACGYPWALLVAPPLVWWGWRGRQRLPRAGTLLVALAIGSLSWLSEATALRLIASSQGAVLSLPHAVLVLLGLNLGTALPLTPANLGTFEASLAFGLTRAGMPLERALVVAAVHHVFQAVTPVLWLGVLSVRKLFENPAR